MRRLGVLLVIVGLVAMAAPAVGQLPEHPHMLIQRPEVDLIDGVPHLVGYRKCVDLAGNRAVPLHAHHQHLHFGDTGEKLFEKAGHAVAPTAPFPGVPWENCADFAGFLPLPLGPPPA